MYLSTHSIVNWWDSSPQEVAEAESRAGVNRADTAYRTRSVLEHLPLNPKAVSVRFSQDQALLKLSAAVHFCWLTAVERFQGPDGAQPGTSVCAPRDWISSRSSHLPMGVAQDGWRCFLQPL